MTWRSPVHLAVSIAAACLTIASLAGQAPATARDDSAYAGSESCRPCHRSDWENWQRSVHVRMTQPAERASLLGDFNSRTTVHDGPDSYTASLKAGHPSVRVASPESDTDFQPELTLGEKRLQGYMSTLPDGRIYVLPLFWQREWQRWIGWRDLTPAPRTGGDQRQIWNINCFNCHATNIQRRFDPRTRQYSTTWSELGVGCEACHGPGREHVRRLTEWGRNPSSYPEIDPDRAGPDFSRQLAIFVPRTSAPAEVFDSCAYCHGNKTNHFVGFAPGSRLDDYAQLSLMSDPAPSTDPQGDFWPDGRPSRFNRPQALMSSGCFQKGGATCASCHAAHGSANEHSLKVPLARADELCTQCHASVGDDHAHHAPASAGSRCVSCHMGDVNWRLLTRRRDHSFAAPVPEVTGRFGVPNACTTCHDDRSPEWAAGVMDRWYGAADRARRATALDVTAILYRATAGDSGALPRIATLAATRSQGALVRASAAGFAGRLMAGRRDNAAVPSAVVNPLVAAASDAESMVRAAAVTSLGQVDSVVGQRALTARLLDPSRVVRARAAESLLQLGITSLPGAAGEALAQAQHEYADSLRSFGDAASQQASLGWLHLARGEDADAARELRLAIALDPSDARPLVYLGVLEARASRFGEAIRRWLDAKRLDPRYPNLDAMIREARTRDAQR